MHTLRKNPLYTTNLVTDQSVAIAPTDSPLS